MKKLGVFLGVLFMGLLIFVRSPAPAHADTWALPFNKVYDIIEMAQTLFSGGKLEFSQVINLTNPLDDILAVWEDFKDKLAHSQTNEQAQFVWNSLVDLARNGQSIIDSNTNLYIPITYDDIAAFTMYDAYWYAQNIFDNIDNPIPNPDPNYSSYLDIINGSGYSPYISLGNGVSGVSSDWNKYGLDWSNVSIFGESYQSLNQSGISNRIYAAPITTLYINSSNGLYSCLVSFGEADMFLGTSANRGYFNKAGDYNSRWGQYFSYEVASNVNTWAHSFQGSLSDVLSALTYCCRNVNIYVDGVLWSYVGTVVSPPVTAPDVIQVGDTGQESYDVYGLELPDDLGLDIPNFIDWILTKLREGATTISLDDAVADEVPLVKTVDGDRAITYEDTRPIWEVITREVTADPDPTPDPNPTPTSNPDDPPILKLPTLNYLPHNHDSTVLAELIDATQNTIPDELMNLIWNCFGLLVIGGLIFILHK